MFGIHICKQVMNDMSNITVSVRFYEELNDYLPKEYHKKDFQVTLPAGSIVRDLLDKFHIPVREVHLVLVNSEVSTIERKLQQGDRLSIYPIFETIDISPITKEKQSMDLNEDTT